MLVQQADDPAQLREVYAHMLAAEAGVRNALIESSRALKIVEVVYIL